jgi:transcriptional regulator with XRE-family HTH domain
VPRTDRPYLLQSSGELASARVAAGLSQAGAARSLGIAAKSLSNIERGTVRASETLLGKMAVLYGVPVTRLQRFYRADRQSFLVRER